VRVWVWDMLAAKGTDLDIDILLKHLMLKQSVHSTIRYKENIF
jgi:hypothetical protein